MKSKKEKQMEAIERQKNYDNLTDKQKENKLTKGGFVAIKERKRKRFKLL